MKNKIGFVGVGRMGANMARRLNEQGFTISCIFDLHTPSATKLAIELDCLSASHPSEVTSSCDIILTVVSDDAAMRSLFQLGGLLKEAQGKLFINCATVSPAVHQAVETLAESVGAESLEACMASSITQAREGTLYLMCAGKSSVFEKSEPILKALSSSYRYIGAAGSAAQVKALVNMVMISNTAALAEGLGLGNALGLDLTMLREVFSETGANSRVLSTDGEDMQTREHSCFFSAAHAAKDIALALEMGQPTGMNFPLAEAALKQYQEMIQRGLGDLDKSGVAELTFMGRGSQNPDSLS
jgi:3-hydroxyisobutyrate dehydrogenase